MDTLGVLARTVGPEHFMPLAQECLQLGMVCVRVLCVRVCVYACVRACMRACVVCVRACVCVHACLCCVRVRARVCVCYVRVPCPLL